MTALLGIPDLGLIAWVLLSVVFAIDAGLFYIGRYFTKNYREPRWQQRAMYEQEAAARRRQAISVRDRSRRGPEPVDHIAEQKKAVGS